MIPRKDFWNLNKEKQASMKINSKRSATRICIKKKSAVHKLLVMYSVLHNHTLSLSAEIEHVLYSIRVGNKGEKDYVTSTMWN